MAHKRKQKLNKKEEVLRMYHLSTNIIVHEFCLFALDQVAL